MLSVSICIVSVDIFIDIVLIFRAESGADDEDVRRFFTPLLHSGLPRIDRLVSMVHHTRAWLAQPRASHKRIGSLSHWSPWLNHRWISAPRWERVPTCRRLTTPAVLKGLIVCAISVILCNFGYLETGLIDEFFGLLDCHSSRILCSGSCYFLLNIVLFICSFVLFIKCVHPMLCINSKLSCYYAMLTKMSCLHIWQDLPWKISPICIASVHFTNCAAENKRMIAAKLVFVALLINLAIPFQFHRRNGS